MEFDVAPAALMSGVPTRDCVVRLLMERGPLTAAALGVALDISPAAVRRHLDGLIAEGLVAEHTRRPLPQRHRGRGRPARVFTLTASGRESFPHAYDDLAAAALRYLGETAGAGAVRQFADARIATLETHVRERLATTSSPHERVTAVADVLTAEGYAASAHPVATGEQLCQHHCPVAQVAAEFPELCEAETRALSRALGTHVQRLATIARGDGMCTTHIPAVRNEQALTTTAASRRKLS